MKIAVRGGHTEKCGGAVALINELKEDRLVKDSVIKYLKKLGYIVCDVTPPKNYTSNENSDLKYGVKKANDWGADLFISIHFNKAYSNYNGALGTEVCVYNKFTEAQRVVDTLGYLGFKNRGQKVRGNSLYELRATNMKSMIIEVCFVEATKDVELYKKVGYDEIGKKIAEAISNKKIKNNTINQSKPNNNNNKPLWECSIDGQIVKDLQYELNKQYRANLKIDGLFGDNTLNKCIIVKKNSRGNITKIIQRRLKDLKYLNDNVDSVFGNNTYNAVIKFQKDRKLNQDGVVGKMTWRELFRK